MKSKPETLVILTPGFPANEADTTCMPPQQLFVKALKETCPGLRIIVISFHYPFKTDEYYWHDIKVFALGGKDNGRLRRLLTWIKAWILLKKLNKNYRVIGLLSFWFGECALVGSYFARRNNLSHYCWVLGQDAKRGNKYFKWIKPQADSLIALSDFIYREVRRNYRKTIPNIIPIGIDTSLFRTGPLKRDIDILGAGSLIPLKQYNLFIETVGFIKTSFPLVNAVICGKGPELDQLKALVTLHGLTNNLTFAGELPHQEVLALMQRSKVFLHTSNYEGYGSVLSEALYAGAHVVSFCKPMNKDYRHHQVVKNKDEMNAEVIKILKNKHTDHDPVLTCTIEQVAKNMISLFADSCSENQEAF
ncbi:MAG TPA: glycosyltransferase [Mucilaginibacter sp.]|jgi:glycosyltransferase involved in cell wall biosynthesis